MDDTLGLGGNSVPTTLSYGTTGTTSGASKKGREGRREGGMEGEGGEREAFS